MKKNYLILNYDYDSAEVVFPKFYRSDDDSYVEFETFNQNLAHNLCEIDYCTKSYTKTCFDFSLDHLEHKPENLKDAKQRLVEHCDYLVKFFRLKKRKAVVKKQWEIESCVSRFKREKERLKFNKDSLSDFVKEDLETRQKTDVRIAKMNHKRFNLPISESYWTIETYNEKIKKYADDIKSSHKKIDQYRSLYKELQKASQ